MRSCIPYAFLFVVDACLLDFGLVRTLMAEYSRPPSGGGHCLLDLDLNLQLSSAFTLRLSPGLGAGGNCLDLGHRSRARET